MMEKETQENSSGNSNSCHGFSGPYRSFSLSEGQGTEIPDNYCYFQGYFQVFKNLEIKLPANNELKMLKKSFIVLDSILQVRLCKCPFVNIYRQEQEYILRRKLNVTFTLWSTRVQTNILLSSTLCVFILQHTCIHCQPCLTALTYPSPSI